jgi:6-phosphogluconolactonase/glucosamine-6-phosphate isomerase/deaminase
MRPYNLKTRKFLDIVYKILEEKDERKRHPAGLINLVRGSLTWLIDQKAAKRL